MGERKCLFDALYKHLEKPQKNKEKAYEFFNGSIESPHQFSIRRLLEKIMNCPSCQFESGHTFECEDDLQRIKKYIEIKLDRLEQTELLMWLQYLLRVRC